MSNHESQLNDGSGSLEALDKVGAAADPSEQPIPEVFSQPTLAESFAVSPQGVASYELAASSPISWGSQAVDLSFKPGIALCLSGGGYRAMLFHLGALWRLNEAGLLSQLKRISSVSGGSITAG